ncbi:acyltransferase [Paraconexibacter algicola]|uniref:acyltransferase n=1 Tax=Paraconexibacter algicola TaxID=2133960 RepID=UPI0025460038|nr:acyltransferase [Paraconexibacter algicola]
MIDHAARDRGLSWRQRWRRRRRIPPFGAFGAGSTIGWPRTVTQPECVFIGADVHLGDYTWFALTQDRSVQVTQGDAVPRQAFDPRLTIGDRTRFGRDLTIACLGEVTIGADVLGGDRILIGDTYHDYRDPDTPVAQQPMAAPRPVRIEDGATLGTGVIVNPGVTIGAGAVVRPGSVVTKDVPPGAHVGGSPARPV